jgi:hypothetical protein
VSHTHRPLRPRGPRRPSTIEAVEPRLLFADFVVSNVADSGPGSLRQAITDSNTAPGPDRVLFNIETQATGTRTINLASPLPAITDVVTIDGTSQPDYSDVDAVPVIELNGAGAGPGANGLMIASSDPMVASTVLGLTINRFQGHGVVISGTNNSLSDSYIGSGATGTAAGPGNAGHGVLITGSHNFVGTSTIAFNGGDGVAVAPAATSNEMSRNSYFSNGGLAIDLGDDGPTPNDAGDADGGANGLQNYPVITSVTPAAAPASGVDVTGSIHTTPNTTVEIYLYAGTDDGEGRLVLERVTPFETDAAGNGTFTVNLPGANASDRITAIATAHTFSAEEINANTSEFAPPPTPQDRPQDVFVRGSTWIGDDGNAANVAFKEYLEQAGLGDDVYGFRLAPGPTNADTVPWINVDEIVLRYSAPVSGAGIPRPETIVVDGVRHDYTVLTVTPLDDRTFALRLDRPLGSVPGGGIEGDRVQLRVAGEGGAEFSRQINVLQGDANRDTQGRVNANDQGYVKSRVNRSATTPDSTTGGASYSAFADIDASGRINSNDQGAVKSRLNDNMPALPAAAAGEWSVGKSATREMFGTQPVV